MEALRVGIVGIENSHVDRIVHQLNVEHRHPARVVALAEGTPERAAELDGTLQLVDSVEDLLPLADALVVADRHGGRHRAHAMAFLEAGRPVFVDKPLACHTGDAREMISAARASGAPLTSYTPLRWLDEFTEIAAGLADIGRLQTVIATGPADLASEHGGLFFYGVHLAGIALGLLPAGELAEPALVASADTGVITCRASGVRVQLNLVCPAESGQVPFHLMAVGRTGLVAREFTLTDEYFSPALKVFIDMATTGVPPLPYEVLLREVALLEAVADT